MGNIGEKHEICRELNTYQGDVAINCESRGLFSKIIYIKQYLKEDLNAFDCKASGEKDHHDEEHEDVHTEYVFDKLPTPINCDYEG